MAEKIFNIKETIFFPESFKSVDETAICNIDGVCNYFHQPGRFAGVEPGTFIDFTTYIELSQGLFKPILELIKETLILQNPVAEDYGFPG